MTPDRKNQPSVYPFAAIVGQEDVKLALVLSVIEPRIAGVLLRGQKGTAKSTAVRSIAQLLSQSQAELPPGNALAPLANLPLHTVPLNATEDRVAGGLDLDQTIASGEPSFSPGLLAAAHESILYVDEVNLLDDHLSDIILDAAASGVNRVEREGVSFQHPSRFALIGTMNPEEGPLRPQVTDRFGLCVDVTGESDLQRRVEVMTRREAFEADPAGFCQQWRAQTLSLISRLAEARTLVGSVRLNTPVSAAIAELGQAAHAAGHRSDLVMTHAARAHAAWMGRDTVTLDDVLAISEMALVHRRREVAPPAQQPAPEPTQSSEADSSPRQEQSNNTPESAADEANPDATAETGATESQPQPDNTASQPAPDQQSEADCNDAEPDDSGDESDSAEQPDGLPPLVPAVGESFSVKKLAPEKDRLARRGSGKRQTTRSATRRGRYIGSRSARTGQDLALDATLRAAALHQKRRRAQDPGRRFIVRRQDWQEKVREHKAGTCIVFVVDASGSMGAQGRMTATKGAILSLLMDAYQKRDRVAMVAFRRDRAETLLQPTASVEVANAILAEMPVGGRTPLAAGLAQAHKVVDPLLRKEPNLRPLVILISDGRGNVRLDGSKGNGTEEVHEIAARLGEDSRVQWVVIDSEARRGMQLGLAKPLATALQAPRLAIEELKAQDLVNIVKGHI